MTKKFKYPSKTESYMLLTTGDKCVVLVEAHSDKRFYGQHIDRKRHNVVVAGDRGKVCDIIDSFIGSNPGRIKGICDRDLLSFGVGSHIREDIFHTDYHDLEMDAISTNNLNSQLIMKFSPEKLEGKNWKVEDVVSTIFEMTKVFGCFRLINETHPYGLSFRDFTLKKGIDYDSEFRINVKAIIKTIINKSGGGVLLKQIDKIEEEINAEIEKEHDLYQISNGHDFVYFLREILKELGTRTPSNVLKLEDIIDLILGTYTPNSFLGSNLGTVLKMNGLLR